MSKINRRLMLKALGAALILPTVPACSNVPARPKAIPRNDYGVVIAHLRERIQHELTSNNVTGLSIALLDGPRMVWADGFGYADKARGVRATARTRYRAGSLSKVLTSAAVMQLAEAGQLDIDAPLVQVLPDFAIKSRGTSDSPITLRMIMSHHSGLPTDRADRMWVENPAHFSSVIEALHDEYSAFPPNLVHAYSNIGFSLLGAAIERVAGKGYERAMHERLLMPLGMADSVFEAAPPSGPMASLAYDDKGEVVREHSLRDVPAGGLNSSALDLLQFARLMMSGGVADGVRVLSESSIAEMQRPQNTTCALDADLRVGLGWHYAPGAVRDGGVVLFHNGATLYHRSVLLMLPDHGLAVAVMANSANAMSSVQEISEYALGLILEAKAGIVQPAVKSKDLPRDERYPPASLQTFPGHYVTDLGLLEIRSDGARLLVDAGGTTLALTPQSNGYLRLEYRVLGLVSLDIGALGKYEFTRAHISGRDVLLARDDGRFLLAGEKIEAKPIHPAWMDRLGDYRYVGSDKFISDEVGVAELKMENGFLLVAVSNKNGQMTLALETISEKEAIVRGLGRSRGDTVHVRINDNQETLCYSGLEFRRKDSTAHASAFTTSTKHTLIARAKSESSRLL